MFSVLYSPDCYKDIGSFLDIKCSSAVRVRAMSTDLARNTMMKDAVFLEGHDYLPIRQSTVVTCCPVFITSFCIHPPHSYC